MTEEYKLPYAGAEIVEKLGMIAQPDWEENDETAAGYIKNRPFYGGITYKKYSDSGIFLEDLTSDANYQIGCGDKGSIINGLFGASTLVVGGQYEITIKKGDVSLSTYTYTCTTIFDDYSLPESIIYFGNGALIDPGTFPNTNEVFCVAQVLTGGNITSYLTVSPSHFAGGVVELEITYAVASETKSIDPMYLPVATSNTYGAVIVDEEIIKKSTNPISNTAVQNFIDAFEDKLNLYGALFVDEGKVRNIQEGNGITLTRTAESGIGTLTISANYTYGTKDLTAGTSPLKTGALYFVYE